MCNYSALCVGMRGVKFLVGDSSDIWKSLDIKYNMIFEVPLIFWVCGDTLLLVRVHSNHPQTR